MPKGVEHSAEHCGYEAEAFSRPTPCGRGHVYGSRRAYLNAGRRMAAVTGTSRGADAGCLYGLNTQNDPRRTARLAWRAGGDDNGLLSALKPVDLTFEFGDLLLSLGQGTRRIRDPIDLDHQTVNQ